MSEFATGRPVVLRAWHNTSTRAVKYGAGGAFCADAPTAEYGDEAIEVVLRFRRPLVVGGDKVDAAAAVGADVAEVERIVVDEIPTSSNPRRLYAKVDALIAVAARRAGHDGIIYTNPMSLSRHEYVALRQGGWRVVRHGGVAVAARSQFGAR